VKIFEEKWKLETEALTPLCRIRYRYIYEYGVDIYPSTHRRTDMPRVIDRGGQPRR
jgi:hypothetical protein